MNGVLIIDKPTGWTSHDVVAKIRSLTKIKKVGHTGTLDPFATGVLPLTLGRATRLTNHFLASDKDYQGVMRFGFATTTFDIEGEALGPDTHPELDPERLEKIFSRYVGQVQQTLPPYSAKKVRGKPLYSYARRGIEMEKTYKEVQIRSLEILCVDGSEVEFRLVCGTGTYARSLAHDIGNEYGCGAHLVRLRRTKSGEFSIQNALSLRDGENFRPREYFLDRIIPLRDLLHEIPAIVVSPLEQKRIAHGNDVNLLTSLGPSKQYRLVDESGELMALGKHIQAFSSRNDLGVQWIRVHPYIIFAAQESPPRTF